MRQCAGARAVPAGTAARCAASTTLGYRANPQHALARDLLGGFGGILSFELHDGIDPFVVLNRLRMVVLSSNLGDNRTLAIPVAHTIFHEMGPVRRAAMGIADSLVRVSVGIEDRDDLLGDFAAALAGDSPT